MLRGGVIFVSLFVFPSPSLQGREDAASANASIFKLSGMRFLKHTRKITIVSYPTPGKEKKKKE